MGIGRYREAPEDRPTHGQSEGSGDKGEKTIGKVKVFPDVKLKIVNREP
jgi:hypothetical protein